MVCINHAKVWTGNDVPNPCEVQALESNLCHLFLIAHELKLVEVFPLFVDLDPGVKAYIRQNLILSLQAELLTKFTTCLCAINVVRSSITRSGFE